MVPFPAPEVPVTTMTGPREALPLEEADQLGPLAFRETSDGLRLADPGLCEEPTGLDPAELGHSHEDVEDLRGRDVLGRLAQDLFDPRLAVFQVPFELSTLDPDVVCALERVHPLVARPGRRLGLSLHGRHGA
jgi:hypothetical protein